MANCPSHNFNLLTRKVIYFALHTSYFPNFCNIKPYAILYGEGEVFMNKPGDK